MQSASQGGCHEGQSDLQLEAHSADILQTFCFHVFILYCQKQERLKGREECLGERDRKYIQGKPLQIQNVLIFTTAQAS